MSNAIKLDMLINGRDVSASEYFKVYDPGRLSELVGEVAVGTAGHAAEAVAAAHEAFQSWRHVPVRERVERLMAAADAMEHLSEQLSTTLVREQGMLLRETRRDVNNGIKSLREMAELAPGFLAPEQFEDGESLVRVEKAPRGVVAAIVPWNAPMGLTMGKVGPALAAGNTVVVKPSSFAPLAVSQALKVVSSFFPPGVVNVLHGETEVGAALTHHPLVRQISFTGGTRTGRAVMAAAAESIKNVNLELGGNDPAIVLDDADPALVVPELIKGIFPRSGQVCYAIKRVYVPSAMMPSFFDELCAAVNCYKVGYGLDPRSTFAPMNNRSQYEVVRGLIERSKQAGATVHELGTKVEPDEWDNGFYVLPTVVKDLAPTAELVVSEQFGPVIPLVAYDSEEQVLKMANDTEYGLASSIWTGDPDRGLRMSSRLEAGVTFINSHARTPLGERHMPFGGVKQSGIGRVRTSVGLAEYIEYHAISLNRKACKAPT
ncbi:aldehyde dehydrogenase family protein [Pusillimonas sp.]|uniref:aldehyde dehydrogenase family protein n=1 Tax=Pusillimonas sp. TaxID=3040095 RepID=UPI0029A712E8|nr:aldehyde dehydrogenase family protein [Pusillimonas sp.]MDX3896247.1 aldehyde dehydrogenase family protein [Pusillimonas sp.]